MAESMKGLKRTHRCAELSAANVGENVTIMGWVQKNRNKGGLVFVDVRDRSGIIQVVFEEGKCEAALIEKAAKLRAEYVVAIVGTVAKRSGAVNDHLATGEIEVIPEELRILSESETPPFHIEENSKTKEEVRLKYRYLDLRRPDMQRNLMMRSKVATLARQFMANEGFLEIEGEGVSSVVGRTAFCNHPFGRVVELDEVSFVVSIFIDVGIVPGYIQAACIDDVIVQGVRKLIDSDALDYAFLRCFPEGKRVLSDCEMEA